MVSEPNPRAMAIASLALGAFAIVFAVVETFFIGEPMNVSSPSPKFTEWLLDTFGMTGLRVLVVLLSASFGILAVRYGMRVLKRGAPN